jgi:hypothetical protein
MSRRRHHHSKVGWQRLEDMLKNKITK